MILQASKTIDDRPSLSELKPMKTKICKECGIEYPVSMFYKYRGVCKKCYNKILKFKDIKGNSLKRVDLGTSEEELRKRLYDEEREVVYTTEDLLEEVRSNGENAIRSLHTTFVIHKELLSDDKCRQKTAKLILELVKQLERIAEVKENEHISNRI